MNISHKRWPIAFVEIYDDAKTYLFEYLNKQTQKKRELDCGWIVSGNGEGILRESLEHNEIQ